MILKFTKECVWHIKKGRPDKPFFACAAGEIVANLPERTQQEIIDAGYAVEAPVSIDLNGNETLLNPVSQDYHRGYLTLAV